MAAKIGTKVFYESKQHSNIDENDVDQKIAAIMERVKSNEAALQEMQQHSAQQEARMRALETNNALISAENSSLRQQFAAAEERVTRQGRRADQLEKDQKKLKRVVGCLGFVVSCLALSPAKSSIKAITEAASTKTPGIVESPPGGFGYGIILSALPNVASTIGNAVTMKI